MDPLPMVKKDDKGWSRKWREHNDSVSECVTDYFCTWGKFLE